MNEIAKTLYDFLMTEDTDKQKNTSAQQSGHHPGTPAEKIKDAREKAFQRAIVNGYRSYLSGDKTDWVDWIDYELPVGKKDTPRDDCIDLLGKDAHGRYVLCELKFSGKSKGNGSPQEAADQLKNYAEQLSDNVYSFRLHKSATEEAFNPMLFKSNAPRLIVAADENYWILRSKEPKDPTVENYAVEVKPWEFEKQKNEAGQVTYRPKMPESGLIWKRI